MKSWGGNLPHTHQSWHLVLVSDMQSLNINIWSWSGPDLTYLVLIWSWSDISGLDLTFLVLIWPWASDFQSRATESWSEASEMGLRHLTLEPGVSFIGSGISFILMSREQNSTVTGPWLNFVTPLLLEVASSSWMARVSPCQKSKALSRVQTWE